MSDKLKKEIEKECENLTRLTKIFKEWGNALYSAPLENEKSNKDQNKIKILMKQDRN